MEALKSLERILSDADIVLCAGDVTGYYFQVNECINFLRDIDAICVLGNHDYFVLNEVPEELNEAVKFGITYSKKTITNENFKWLSRLPLVNGFFIGKNKVLLCHGSPFNPLYEYLYNDNPTLLSLEQFEFNLIIYGQTHRKNIIESKNKLFINPGSVGQSRDEIGIANAIIFDDNTNKVEIISREYDFNKVINLAKENGAGDWIYKYLKKY